MCLLDSITNFLLFIVIESPEVLFDSFAHLVAIRTELACVYKKGESKTESFSLFSLLPNRGNFHNLQRSVSGCCAKLRTFSSSPSHFTYFFSYWVLINKTLKGCFSCDSLLPSENRPATYKLPFGFLRNRRFAPVTIYVSAKCRTNQIICCCFCSRKNFLAFPCTFTL